MAKQEYDKTPLETAQVSTERLQEQAPWALAVARTGLLQHLGDNFKKNKPVEFEKLQNWIAQQLVVAQMAGMTTWKVVNGKPHKIGSLSG